MTNVEDVFVYYFRFAHEKETVAAYKHYTAAKCLINAFISNAEEYEEYLGLMYNLYHQVNLNKNQKQLLNTMGLAV